MWGPRCIEDLKCEGKAVGLDGNGICRDKSQNLGQVCNEMWGPRCVDGLKCERKSVGLDSDGICRGKDDGIFMENIFILS